MKKLLLAGVGAVSLTAEKAEEFVKALIAKGELTVEQGRALNEELQRQAREKQDQRRKDDLYQEISRLSPEERAELKKKLDDEGE